MKLKNKYWDFIESSDYEAYYLSKVPSQAPESLVEAAEYAEGVRDTTNLRKRLVERFKRFKQG
jgi:hypothetical protein